MKRALTIVNISYDPAGDRVTADLTYPAVFVLRCKECRRPRDRIVPEADAEGQHTYFFKCKSCGHYNVVRVETRRGCMFVLD